MKIGIPRALLYYEFFPLWKTFFETLDTGIEIVVSNPTTKKTIEKGSKYTIDEACLPFKVHRGHVIELRDKVDYIFIPRIASSKKSEYMCAKFLGLPDTIKNTVPGLAKKIIDTNFDANSVSLKKSFYELGKRIAPKSKNIKLAYKKALEAQKNFNRAAQKIQDPENITRLLENKPLKEKPLHPYTVALIGHPYNLYDSYVNMNIIKKLEAQKFSVVTPDMLPEEITNKEVREISEGIYWTLSKRIMGACGYYAKQDYINGIVFFLSFPCGPESLTESITRIKLENKLKGKAPPMMTLIIDALTADAGLETRIEAFTEMIIDKNQGGGKN